MGNNFSRSIGRELRTTIRHIGRIEKERWSGAKLIIGLVRGDVVQATNGPVNVKPRCNCRFDNRTCPAGRNIFDHGEGGEVSRLLFRFPRHRSVRVDPPGERMIFVPPDFGHDNSNTV